MKHTRHKRVCRLLSLYRHCFAISPPYRVLLDGTFCQSALENQINLQEQMCKYLSAPTVMCTTGCVLRELEALGGAVYGALHICRQFDVEPCPHRPARAAIDCLAHMARRMQKADRCKYLIATQDQQLTDALRAMIGVPVLYIKYKSILLEKASEVTMAEAERCKYGDEMGVVKEMKRALIAADEGGKKKKRRRGGPNPLSCKKKQKTMPIVKQEIGKSKSRRRRKRGKAAASSGDGDTVG